MSNDLDVILFEIEEKGLYSFILNSPQNVVKAKERLLREGLIEKRGRSTYVLTEKGQTAIDLGGYETWIKQQEEEKSRANQIKVLTIKQLKGNIFHLKYWWLLILLSGLVGFIAGNFERILNWFE